MKRIITRYLLAFGYLLLFSQSAIAQNFLWGRSGGSMETTSGSDDETVTDMATDRNGNIYILAEVKKNGLQIAKQPITGYGASDVMLASFTPKGVLRWVKMIGNGDDDTPRWLGTDAKDGVYLSASLNKRNNVTSIDKDAISPKNAQVNILIKYDTAGKFQWYRHPEMDTFTGSSIYSNVGTWAMDVTPSGDVYWLMQLIPGGYGGGAIKITDTANYLLKYSSSGGLSISKPNLRITGVSGAHVAMTVDEANNRFYLSGYDAHSSAAGVWFNGKQLPKQSVYVGCFKLDGSYMWSKESTSGSGNFFSRVALDVAGNIYIAGQGSGADGSGNPALVFNGYTVNSGTPSSRPIIIKMDKNGNLLWGKTANTSVSSGGAAVAVRNADEVMLLGSFNVKLEWPGYSGSLTSTSYDLFITRFSTSNGDVKGMDMIPSSTGTDYPRRMIADGKGNVYLGGEFTQRLFVNYKDTLVNTAGGTTDWFLIKYGDMWPAGVSTSNAFTATIYPNPAMEQITVSGIAEGTEIRVLNMLDQQVLQTISSGETEVLNTSALVPGSYIIQLKSRDGEQANCRIEKR
jgi:hypothetical protein